MRQLIAVLYLSAVLAQGCTNLCDGDHYCYNNSCYSCTPYRQFWERSKPDWGVEAGLAHGVPGFSNFGDPQVGDESKDEYMAKEVTGFKEDVYVGQKYQCVHYARHYWIINFGAGFGSIPIAQEIFYQKKARDYVNGGYREMISIPNGSKSWPKVGDLLIWAYAPPDFPAGHVAVIVQVELQSEQKHILIAEQNYDDAWDSKYYSRALVVEIDMVGNAWVKNQRIRIPGKEIEGCKDYNGASDAKILGWVRLGQPI